jgi:hypothetical protein
LQLLICLFIEADRKSAATAAEDSKGITFDAFTFARVVKTSTGTKLALEQRGTKDGISV